MARNKQQPNSNNTDRMKWVIVTVSALMFFVTMVVSLFREEQRTTEVVNVFLIVSGFVFGTNVINLFRKP